jgi:hypothetical protein
MEAFTTKASGEHPFSGVGCVMGCVDGIQVTGIDLDHCCDAETGKFTPESRQIVIGLDSYSEFSPSGTGAHILVLGDLRGRERIHEAFPGTKSVEIYNHGQYLTFTGRHLSKTPADIVLREDAVNNLYDRVMAHKGATGPQGHGLTVSVSLSEDERLEQLMHGKEDDSVSLYDGDHSKADFALCCLLAKKYNCNAFKIDAAFRESNLVRDKWDDREDYRETTITKACTAVAKELPILFDHEVIDDDSPTEYIVPAIPGENEGWFPKGELSLIGAASGRGKTSWMLPLLEDIRQCKPVWGHPAGPSRDYRVLLHDRSIKATKRTIDAQHLTKDAATRLIRLTSASRKLTPAQAVAAYIEQCPGVEAWFIEGLDMWLDDDGSMHAVSASLDDLCQVAAQFDVAIAASVGSPKMKGKDRYYGRDSLFGSSALGRKTETIVLMNLTDEKDGNSARQCDVLLRNSAQEKFYFGFVRGVGLVKAEKPSEHKVEEVTLTSPEMLRTTVLVQATFHPDEKVVYRDRFGSIRSFNAWRDLAEQAGIVYRDGRSWLLTPQVGGATLTTDEQKTAKTVF